jgi:hypothetical protein
MLVYRPSRGNDTVTLTYSGEWTGQSIGREVVVRDKFGPADYFLWYYADLSSDSTWFYKPVTNVDFIAGTTYYRALYVGPHENENLQEYVGSIVSSADTCTSGSSATSATSGTSDIQVSLWKEGLFTTTNSKNSITLDNEFDSTSVLVSAGATFTPSLVVNQTLSVGQYIKIWVKITVPQNPALADEDNCYIINVGSVSIPVIKDKSRLSLSNVFHGDLNDDKIILKELIPKIDEMGKIHKVINIDRRQSHIFYNNISGGDFHDLIVERNNNIYDSKYIDVNASAVTGPITGVELASSITLKAPQSVFTCLVSAGLEVKNIVDIFVTNLPEKSHFYIFYNKLNKSDSGTVSTSAGEIDKYSANYGHNTYYWSCGVIHLDLNTFRDETFDETPTGYDNKLVSNNWTGEDYKLKDNFYLTSVSLQDDLFTSIGYNTENSYQTEAPSAAPYIIEGKNYFTELMFLWEKDILLDDVKTQTIKTPEMSIVNTIENRSNKTSQLVIDNWNGINSDDLLHYKNTYFITDTSGATHKYCDLGSPHGGKLKHYEDTSISFDTQENLNEWSSTFSFRMGVVEENPTSFYPYDYNNASHEHMVYATDAAIVTGSNLSKAPVKLTPSISGNVGIFAINVKNSTYNTLTCSLDTTNNVFNITTLDSSGGTISTTASNTLYLGQENVITINTTKKQVHNTSCVCRSFVNYQVYLNGSLLSEGMTYVIDSLDPLVVTYNPDKKFSGSLSYFEVKPYLDKPQEYANVMYKIHGNFAWTKLLENIENTTATTKELQVFKNKRTFYFNNLPTSTQEIIVPVVLQGAGYKFEDTYTQYNKNTLRTYDDKNKTSVTFDFKLLNLNTIDLAFTMAGDSKLLDWTADEYDIVNDRLVVWVKIPKYTGQKFTIYYNSQRIAARTPSERPNAFVNNHGTWTMNAFATTFGYRFVDQKIFNVGENIIYLQKQDEKYLVQIDYQYMYGVSKIYKSNKFDVAFDDRTVTPESMEYYESFIGESISLFKPDYMTINKVRSKFDYRLESDNYTPKE